MPKEIPVEQAFICVTCGSQFAPTAQPPLECPICADPRQYVGLDGQRWTTLDELRTRHHNNIQMEEPGLYSIHRAQLRDRPARSSTSNAERQSALGLCCVSRSAND